MLRALPAVPESTSPPRPSVQEEPPEGKGSVTTAAAVHEDIASHRTSSTDHNVASDDSCGMDDILRTFIESGDTSTTTSAPDVDWNAGGEALPPQHAHGVMFDTIPGFGYNTENDPSPAQSGQFYWGGYFRTHFFIDPTENIIALFMTQKLPYGEEYNIALNQAVYGSF